jgi:hypothetical protein
MKLTDEVLSSLTEQKKEELEDMEHIVSRIKDEKGSFGFNYKLKTSLKKNKTIMIATPLYREDKLHGEFIITIVKK